MNTKERIVDIAIRLFNKSGTKDITTNHIAEAANISPGNLYYHFRNKEEIIRSIYVKMIELIDSTSTYGSGFKVKPSIENMEALFKKILTCQWEYRFFYREMNALVNRDRELKSIFTRHRKKWSQETRDSIQAFIGAGFFKETDAPTVDFMNKALWIIGTYWHSFLEAEGDRITIDRVEEGIEMLRRFLMPYIREVAVER